MKLHQRLCLESGRIISRIVMAGGDIREIVYFVAPDLRIKATARKYKYRRKPTVSEILITMGRPNYKERLLLKRGDHKFPFTTEKKSK